MHTDQPDLVPRLWNAARAMFARMRDAIGEAAAIAARTALSVDERRAIRQWLVPLEAMARKVVLVHALALAERGDTYARRRRDTHARAAAAKHPPPQAIACVSPSAPPAVTLIALPAPPVRILTQAAALAAHAPRRRVRPPALRLWPRTPAIAARVRGLGANLLVREVERERARLAWARQLAAARRKRMPEPQRLGRRIDALARLLDHPLAAARRLARVLVARPLLALELAMKRAPRARFFPEPEYGLCFDLACRRAYDFGMQKRDTS